MSDENGSMRVIPGHVVRAVATWLEAIQGHADATGANISTQADFDRIAEEVGPPAIPSKDYALAAEFLRGVAAYKERYR